MKQIKKTDSILLFDNTNTYTNYFIENYKSFLDK